MSPKPTEPRFEQVELAIVWAALMALDVALQYVILQELATEFAFASLRAGSPIENMRVAVQGLHIAAFVLGRSPSIKEFRRLRSEMPELDLPADSSITRWLSGGWDECLQRALLDAASDGDFLSRPYGLTDRFSDDEVLAALRECADSLGHAPSMLDYMQWAQRPDVIDRPGRRPRSFRPFDRFGGWRVALTKAGVSGADQVRHAVDGRPLPRRYAYSSAEVMEALRTVAARVGHSPRPSEYLRERELVLGESVAKGEMHLIPTVDAVRRRFGSWDQALNAVGLAAVETRTPPFTGMRRPDYTTEEKLRWLLRAWRVLGDRFTADAYTEWRRAVIADGTNVPSIGTLLRTFGGWRAACEAARAAGQADAARRHVDE